MRKRPRKRRTREVGEGKCRSCREVRELDCRWLLCVRCRLVLLYDQFGRERPEDQRREWMKALEGDPGSRKKRQRRPKKKVSLGQPKWKDGERYRSASLAYAFGDRR